MSECRFLVDECVPSSLVRGLRRRVSEVDAIQVGEQGAPPKGTPDHELLIFCEHDSRLLVTSDRATVPSCFWQHLAQGHHTWGILVIGPGASLSHTLDELALVYSESSAKEWIDVLQFLPMFHERTRA